VKIVEIKRGRKVVKILMGSEAEIVMKAANLILRRILERVENKKISLEIKSGQLKFDISEISPPISYSQAVIEALEKGFKNPYEIADYVFQQRFPKMKKSP